LGRRRWMATFGASGLAFLPEFGVLILSPLFFLPILNTPRQAGEAAEAAAGVRTFVADRE
jgi:hypothetical protein